jgi:hypothetical protein
MRTRSLALPAVVTALALPAAADAAVRCVDTTGPDCATTHTTTGQAIGVALNGDTIRLGAGVHEPVDTPKVLTWVGVGAGTLDSTAGATIIRQPTATENAMNLPNGGTVRDLRAEGGPYPGGMTLGGAGINFAPVANGDMTLNLVDVIAAGGASPTPLGGGRGLVLGETATTGSKVATVTGGAFLGSSTPNAGVAGIETCCMRSTITGALIRTAAGAGVRVRDGTVTLDRSTVEGVTGISTQGPADVTVNRTRVDAVGVGLFLRSGLGAPTDALIRDSLLTAGSSEGETGGAVSIEGATGDPVVFDAVGSTFVGRGISPAIHARRDADGSATITATLHNSIARAQGSSVDLLADRASIGAQFSSFTTRTLANGGTTPAPGAGSNVAGNPLLGADFTLQPGSPAIDRGDPAAVLPGELDLAGAARSLDGNGDCVAAPDMGAFERANACAPVNLPPELTNLRVTNRVFAPVARARGAGSAARRRPKRGTRFRYTLSEAARVTIRIERALPGRVSRKGGRRRCVKPTRKNRGARRCKRFKRVQRIVADEQAGAQSTRFTGRKRGRALKAGRYRARVVATDAAGARSSERRVSFRIVRP